MLKSIIGGLFSVLIFLVIACSDDIAERVNPYEDISGLTEYIEESSQRTGDPIAGEDYLLYGDFVDSGVPAEFYDISFGILQQSENLLDRTGPNAEIAFPFSQVPAFNGVEVVSPNCFQCHAGFVDGQFMIGLGNTSFDNTMNQGSIVPFLDQLISARYGEDSPEYAAYIPFSDALRATTGQLMTEVIGANSADKLAVVLAAHRDPIDLTWSREPLHPIPSEVIPADVPAWWLLKKKHAMFSTGIGRGDFARIMMASSVLTMQDSAKAREVDNRFADVYAFINSLDAPAYSGQIDAERASRGMEVFTETCSKCHGTYGLNDQFPNLLIKQELIQTDPLLAESNFAYDDFVSWYNNSWFAQEPYSAQIVPGDGYVAPPLDGIWATAPYLHNGSVPTLADLLHSQERPSLWRKLPGNSNYDHTKMGISYSIEDTKIDDLTYDVSLRGYGNQGHYFADHLTDPERIDLLEYLKTL